MADAPATHADCRNYAPLDVVKGICHRSKDVVLGDDPACEHHQPMPRCRHCRSFVPGDEPRLGTCTAGDGTRMTYPDLVALGCDDFSWREPPGEG